MATKSAKPVKVRRAKQNQSDFYGGAPSLRGTIIKIVLLGLLDAFALFIGFILLAGERYDWLIGLAITVTALNVIYLRPKGGLAAKYIAPGLVFLIFFQVYIVFFSGYTAFTNYGTTHNGSKEDAVVALQQSAFAPVDSEPIYNLTVSKDPSGDIAFIMADPETSQVLVGTEDTIAKEVTSEPGVTIDEIGMAHIEGYKDLTEDQISELADNLLNIRVPAGADLNEDGFYATTDAFSAQLNKFSLIYQNGEFYSVVDGTTYKPTDKGFFTNENGENLPTGWTVNVGTANFENIFTNETLREPLIRVFTWTMVFAILSVLTTFILGLALALLFDDNRLRGKKLYRSLVILPYAFPAFLSAFIWKGLFQTEGGYINNAFFNWGPFADNPIPWLEDPTLAKLAILILNLWLGFPYMFLISTGALQAIPGELTESATIDGATGWQQFRLIKLPLLLVSLAPLLISSFAFNFNNFTIVYLLTGGGPSSTDASAIVDAGATDILITFVYKIAFFAQQGRDFGLASAFSMLIFLIVGSISLISFRRTRTLEDIN